MVKGKTVTHVKTLDETNKITRYVKYLETDLINN